MISSFKRVFLICISLLAFLTESQATHLRAGEITAVRVNCSGRTYRITLTIYIDTESRIMLGGPNEILYFGDSTWVEVPETTTILRPDLGQNMGIATFTVEHTYAGPGKFLIRYAEPFRNGDVINLDNPLSTMFYIETSITIDPFIGCDNAPLLLVPPIDKACTGAAWFHNPGAYDLDGDSLSYDLVVPYQDKGTPVSNYRLPNKQEFYDRAGIDYGTASEDGFPPTFSIDSKTGTLTWDAPGGAGEYNIAFVIKQWRKLNGVWLLLGYVERDMQIIVDDCDNQRPELTIPEDICVEAGTEINQLIFAFDPDSDSVKIEAFSEVFIVNPSPATMIPGPPNGNVKHLASSPLAPAQTTFNWKTDCAHIKDQPYQVVFKVTDKPAEGAKLIEFKTWNIRIVGPAPKWEDVSLDVNTRSSTVEWEPYLCENAERMEVWRRVDQYPFVPPECVTGIPAFLGFTKIAQLPIDENSYTDTNGGRGLAVGAQYCYRLVAVFKQPGGGESYVSKDTCLAPIIADAPVITNVSVLQTDIDEGEIEVKWVTAFDVDPIQFPPPYKYEVWRSEGIIGASGITNVSGKISDTFFVDTSSGLNTEDMFYNYRIVQYDANDARVDTSFAASSVRVEATPQVQKIELNWAADVPWTNRTQDYPTHFIYRGAPGDATLTLIAEVDVNANGFRYMDEGPLQETQVYCYVIETQGAYGNPNIPEPLRNFSQRICAQPNDTTKPCAPVLNIEPVTCEQQASTSFCGLGPFRNMVTWNQPTEECRADIRSYQIWIADKIGGTYSLHRENVRDTFFIDTNVDLTSFARCYKVAAVDRSNNLSDFSEEFCFDNCPYYELPNVFTPGGDDDINMVFSAFGDPADRDMGDETDPEYQQRCAKFVESVDFIVYNRWGTEVYRRSGLRDDQIYIRWDGRDTQGKELDGGVYYFIARVSFITVNPEQEVAEYKGWVHLIRG
jgi:hypothetical protein